MRMPWSKKEKPELLGDPDKAKLSCMVRTSGKIETLRKIKNWGLLDDETQNAAVAYVKSL